MVKFAEFTKDERRTVAAIVNRAVLAGYYKSRRVAEMDLSATHATCPLRLAELFDADQFNFAHDIIGIREHLNRETGELEGFFLPRFSR